MSKKSVPVLGGVAKFVLVVAASALIAAAAIPAHAACSTGGYSVSAGIDLNYQYSYIRLANCTNPDPSTVQGRFWLLGSKNTRDSGAYIGRNPACPAHDNPSCDWILGSTDLFISGDWGANPGILGCPNPAEGGPAQPTPVVVQITAGHHWAISCVAATGSGGNQSWNFDPVWNSCASGADLALGDVRPRVQTSVVLPNNLLIVTLAPVTTPFYGDASCAALGDQIAGAQKIYRQCLPDGTPPPTTALPGAWTLAPAGPIVESCSPASEECYYMSGTNVDGEEVGQAVSFPVDCRFLAERPNDKLIKRPVRPRTPGASQR